MSRDPLIEDQVSESVFAGRDARRLAGLPLHVVERAEVVEGRVREKPCRRRPRVGVVGRAVERQVESLVILLARLDLAAIVDQFRKHGVIVSRLRRDHQHQRVVAGAHRRVERVVEVALGRLAQLVVNDEARRQAVLRRRVGRQGGEDRAPAIANQTLDLLSEPDDIQPGLECRRVLDDRDHLREDFARLEPVVRRRVDLAALLRFGSAEVTEGERRGELRLAVLTAHRQDRGSGSAARPLASSAYTSSTKRRCQSRSRMVVPASEPCVIGSVSTKAITRSARDQARRSRHASGSSPGFAALTSMPLPSTRRSGGGGASALDRSAAEPGSRLVL